MHGHYKLFLQAGKIRQCYLFWWVAVLLPFVREAVPIGKDRCTLIQL